MPSKFLRLCACVQSPEATWGQEAYLLFPVYRDGTVLDHLTRMQEAKTYFPTITVLHIFQQLCGFSDHEFLVSFILQSTNTRLKFYHRTLAGLERVVCNTSQ